LAKSEAVDADIELPVITKPLRGDRCIAGIASRPLCIGNVCPLQLNLPAMGSVGQGLDGILEVLDHGAVAVPPKLRHYVRPERLLVVCRAEGNP
jgi:hypothetical protein